MLSAHLTFHRVVGGFCTLPVEVHLAYDEADPFAVTLTFVEKNVRWRFARDLLAEGMAHPAGLGDVRVWPDATGHVTLGLAARPGWALFRMPRGAVADFLAGSYACVLPGRECVEGALAALLDGR